MKKIKLFEAFSGIGTQSMALDNINANFEVVAFSEIDKYAIDMYCHLHNIDKDKNLGDISKINEKEIPDFNLMTYSFPCFVKDTLVLTNNGYVNIQDIKKGDLVLTHTNTFKKVVKPMINKANKIYKIKSSISEDLLVTEEHPFYVRKKNELDIFNPLWVDTKDLEKKKHLLGVAINKESVIPKINSDLDSKLTFNEFWWLVGKFFCNGIVLDDNSILIYDSNTNINEYINKLNNLGFEVLNASDFEYKILFKDLGLYLETFENKGIKTINNDIISLPQNLIKEFVDSYLSVNGYCTLNNDFKLMLFDRIFIYSFIQCYIKAYNKPFTFNKKTTRYSNKTIYEIYLDNNNDCFFENGYLWCEIEHIDIEEYNDKVYNFEVEKDNSYVVQNIIAHNCQDLSISGKQKGIIKGQTRSGLLWECERIISHKKPKYLLMENVKNLLSKTHINDFHKWCKALEDLGYTNYIQVLNSKDYGVPQNRQRVFMISVLGEHKPYKFPEPFELTKSLKDVIDYDVDEKYYMNKPFSLVNKKNVSAELQMHSYKSIRQVQSLDQIAPTLTTCQGGHRQAKILIAAKIDNCSYESNSRIYDTNGISGTLCARDFKGPQKILTGDSTEYKVRKLTPIEYWRLMGIKEDVIEKALLLEQSNAQMYKQAGNAIVVDVLEHIFLELINIMD